MPQLLKRRVTKKEFNSQRILSAWFRLDVFVPLVHWSVTAVWYSRQWTYSILQTASCIEQSANFSAKRPANAETFDRRVGWTTRMLNPRRHRTGILCYLGIYTYNRNISCWWCYRSVLPVDRGSLNTQPVLHYSCAVVRMADRKRNSKRQHPTKYSVSFRG